MRYVKKDAERDAFLDFVSTQVDALPEPDAELDLLPEHCHYRDDGCSLAPACLECPFPRCVYERPGGRFRWLKDLRNRQIRHLFLVEKLSAAEIAERLLISPRTVRRTLTALRHSG